MRGDEKMEQGKDPIKDIFKDLKGPQKEKSLETFLKRNFCFKLAKIHFLDFFQPSCLGKLPVNPNKETQRCHF